MKILSTIVLLGSATLASAQTPPDVEQRLADLERKMRILDPSFQTSAGSKLDDRLKTLEAKIDELLKQRAAPSTPQAQIPPQVQLPIPAVQPQQEPVPAGPIQPVSITGDFARAENGETRLPIAGYMDFHVNRNSGEPWLPDFHRFVLLFGHSFSDRIKFWSELEVEHSFIEGGEETGEVALEQAYLDFLIKPRFNVRGGMVLLPIGIVNERHEPPAYNGVERPFVETIIIPTTWRELGFGFTGDLGKGFRYRTYLTGALNASQFNAENGIADGKTNGFDSSMRNPAIVGRVEYAGVRRLTLGASLYSGLTGFDTPGVNPRVTLAEADVRYSFRQMDFRGLYANTWVSQAAQLNLFLQQRTGVNPNVAKQMLGYYFEPAYHNLPRRFRNDIIAFARYEKYNTQQSMPAGYVPLQQFNRSS